MIELTSVYDHPAEGIVMQSLYALLQERTPDQAISHREMPSFTDHIQFVRAKPYLAWYFIRYQGQIVGSVYLSKQREIGVAIFQRHLRKGFGGAATKKVMELHPGGFLANVNPRNVLSQHLFERLGFRKIQVTYRKEA